MRGTYVLVLEVLDDVRVKAGRLGTLNVKRGIYLYVGSARGPGKFPLEARLRRHHQKKKKRFWHIDYLTTHRGVRILPTGALVSQRWKECVLRDRLVKEVHGTIPFKDFGSSDCRCGGHLIYVPPQHRRHLQREVGRLGEVSTTGEMAIKSF